MGEDRTINNLNDLCNDIDLLVESPRWGMTVWNQRGEENQHATEAATGVEEVTEERDIATVDREAATTAE